MARLKVSSLALALGALLLTGAGCLPWPVSLVQKAVNKAMDKGESSDYSDEYYDDYYSDDYYDSVTEVSLPSNFPSDVPVYDGSITSATNDSAGVWLTVETYDYPDSVVSWYQYELDYEGWSEEGRYDEDGVTTLIYTKGSDMLGVAIEESGDKTYITLTVQPTY